MLVIVEWSLLVVGLGAFAYEVWVRYIAGKTPMDFERSNTAMTISMVGCTVAAALGGGILLSRML